MLNRIMAVRCLWAVIFGVVMGLAVSTAGAADITWQQPSQISGDGDVSTDGTLVVAANLGHAATTVNGVIFQELAVGNQVNTLGNATLSGVSGIVNADGSGSMAAPFTNLSASYRALLDVQVASDQMILTFSGLTVGGSYQVEVWNNESGSWNPPNFTFSARLTAGNSVDLDPNTSIDEGGLGQYVIGTFVADGSTQQINITGDEIGGVFNAFQLRQISPAPPQAAPAASTTGLLALCSLLLLAGVAALPRGRQRRCSGLDRA